jgi:hypothetical protein
MFIEFTFTGSEAARVRRSLASNRIARRIGTSKTGVYFMQDGKVWFVGAHSTVRMGDYFLFREEIRMGIHYFKPASEVFPVNDRQSTDIVAGLKYKTILPSSEVCMHMRVAGKPMLVELLPGRHAVQLYTPDGVPFSSPILPGEAGVYDRGSREVSVYYLYEYKGATREVVYDKIS